MEHYKAESLPQRESRKDNPYIASQTAERSVHTHAHTHTWAGINRVFCPRYRGSVELLAIRMSHTQYTYKFLPELKNRKAHGVITAEVASRQCI